MGVITSPRNPRVKNAIRLRDRRHRQREACFLIDGIRELQRAVIGRVELVEVFFCPGKCTRTQCQRLTSMIGDIEAEIIEVSEPVFEKLAFGDRAEGVVAVAQMPSLVLGNIVLPETPLVAVIEGIEKPGNVGAVLRSADAAGVDAVVVADGKTDLFNPNAVRASLGAIFTLPVCEATTAETTTWLCRNGLQILAARVDGAVPHTQIDYRHPTAIVLGSESRGLSHTWRAADMVGVRLPMLGKVDSLNISAAAAVLFYEARRQRELS